MSRLTSIGVTIAAIPGIVRYLSEASLICDNPSLLQGKRDATGPFFGDIVPESPRGATHEECNAVARRDRV